MLASQQDGSMRCGLYETLAVPAMPA